MKFTATEEISGCKGDGETVDFWPGSWGSCFCSPASLGVVVSEIWERVLAGKLNMSGEFNTAASLNEPRGLI